METGIKLANGECKKRKQGKTQSSEHTGQRWVDRDGDCVRVCHTFR